MKITVKRQLNLKQYEYCVVNNPLYIGIANCTYGILLRKLQVFYNNTMLQYSIKQIHWQLIGLRILPFLGLIPSYYFYSNGKQLGKTKIRFMSPKRYLNIQNDIYEFYLHAKNYISVMKNDIQIALIKKEYLSENESNVYNIDYDDNVDIGLMLIFCMFIDIMYFPNRFRYDYVKYETTINISKDKYIERTQWSSYRNK